MRTRRWPDGHRGPSPKFNGTRDILLVGHPAYTTDDLSADLHRFAFLLGATDGEELFGEPVAMITNTDTARQLDRITRITPTRRGWRGCCPPCLQRADCLVLDAWLC
jgi:hypothetical protein